MATRGANGEERVSNDYKASQHPQPEPTASTRLTDIWKLSALEPRPADITRGLVTPTCKNQNNLDATGADKPHTRPSCQIEAKPCAEPRPSCGAQAWG